MLTVQPEQALPYSGGLGPNCKVIKETGERPVWHSKRGGDLDKKLSIPDSKETEAREYKDSVVQTGAAILDDSVDSSSTPAGKPKSTRKKRSSHVQTHLRRLSVKLQAQKTDLVSKAKEYIKDCHEDHSEGIKDFGGVNTPTGIIMQLMLALVYTMVNCEQTARSILVNITAEVGKQTVIEVIDAIWDIAEDMEKQESPISSSEGENDLVSSDDADMTTEEDNAFLSELLTENILNTQEMMKLIEVLANKEHFENTTAVEDVLSELDQFGLDDLLDRPNYTWISYPVDPGVNNTAIGDNVLDSVLDSLNSNVTRRLIRETTIPIQMDFKTRLLIIYDVSSQQLLSVKDGGLTLSEYDKYSIQNQLWIHDEGHIFNVGSHLALVTRADGNISTPVFLGKIEEVSHWRLYGGRLSYGSHQDCFLRIASGKGHMSVLFESQNITVDCGIQATETDVRVVTFKDTNTPERFTQHLERPLSLLQSFVLKLANTKFLIFTYLLNYIFKSSMHNYKRPSYINVDKKILQETFFIKNTHKKCKLLSHSIVNENTKLVFQDFTESSMEFQLWYWKENQILNVGSHTALELNISITMGSKYFRLWEINEGRVTTLHNESCELLIDRLTDYVVVDCDRSNVEIDSIQHWEFIEFDKPNFNNFVDVVCMFFVQSSLWPCEFMTLPTGYDYPMVSPLADNIFTQLWYMSDGRLINTESGKALSEMNSNGSIGMSSLNNTDLTKWLLVTDQIIKQGYAEVVTVDTERNGRLYISQNNHLHKQTWKIISVEDALADNESLSCTDDISNILKPFVIRNDRIPACQLLTVIDNNGTFDLKMKHFDGSDLDKHLWVMHRGVIINVASGRSIEPEMTRNKGNISIVKVVPRKLHAFQHRQMWFVDDLGLIQWKPNSQCFIDYQKDPLTQGGAVVIKCDQHKKTNPHWSFVDLPKNETDVEDTLNYMCFYFIRSKTEPCQYITADIEDGTIHLRPLSQNLLEKQLWYWNERTIYLATTGQVFGSAGMEFDKGYPWLSLKFPDENGSIESWIYRNDRLVSHPYLAYISVDLDTDGKLFLSNTEEAFDFDLSFIDFDTFIKNDSGSSCALPLNEQTKVFFIRSHRDNCLMLTEAGRGKNPIFKYFDQEDITSQLWFYYNNHLINLKTNLALHADVKSVISGSRAIMQEYYKYAAEQKWVKKDNMIYYGETGSCALSVDMQSDGSIVVWCRAQGRYNHLWDFIDFDDDARYSEEITCMFFLRHETIPCELLTYVDVGVFLRPIKDEFLDHQIWFWSGERIVNAVSGLVLDVSETLKLSLRQINVNQTSQKWTKDGMYVKHIVTGKVIGLDVTTGELKIFNQVGISESHTKWSFIDLNDGLNTPSTLSCEIDLTNPILYYLKSDKEPCHVLSESSNGEITLTKAGDENSNQVWVRIRQHIVSAKTANALSIDNFTNGDPVRTQFRNEHKINQHWRQTGTSVQITSSGNTLLLDAYSDVCVWSPDGSDGQKWVWLNVRDVENDIKLLRCSKCYNKAEEKANEVMSYIPIFGWLYSLIRAPVYAAKGCKDVAVESLINLAIDTILDIGLAVVTILTAGTASGLAYGVKTALKSGIKAGIKATLKALSSSIKLAVRQAINAGKAVLKQGLKKTVINFPKKGLKNIKHILKSNIRLVKQLPSTTKSFVVKSVSSVKKVSTKLYNSIRSTTYGSLKSSVAHGLRELPSVLKKKLNKIGNLLAEKAENKIKKLDDLKKNKPTSHIRCKRGGKLKCNTGKKRGSKPTPDVNLQKTTAFVPNPDKEVLDNFEMLLQVAREKNQANLKGLQNAHFGLKREPLGTSAKPATFDKNTVHSKVLSEVDEYPLDKNYKFIKKDTKKHDTPQAHTEQALLKDIDDSIRKNCRGHKCELYLWTKNSPCMRNSYMFEDGKNEAAKSCFAMLLELCYHKVKTTPGFKMCHIGFSDFYGLAGRKSPDILRKEFMQELSDLTETVKYLASNSGKLTQDALADMKSFIKFYQIIP